MRRNTSCGSLRTDFVSLLILDGSIAAVGGCRHGVNRLIAVRVGPAATDRSFVFNPSCAGRRTDFAGRTVGID